MLPVTVAENVDPQMPLERFSRQGARELREEKNRLCRFKQKPRARNLAEFCGEVGPLARYNKYFYINELSWLCWQSEANPSLPANLGNAGRLREIAGKAPTYSCRKPRTLNALDRSLPNLTSRENLVHRREGAAIRSQIGDARCVPTADSLT